jgi:hypothetical protein
MTGASPLPGTKLDFAIFWTAKQRFARRASRLRRALRGYFLAAAGGENGSCYFKNRALFVLVSKLKKFAK